MRFSATLVVVCLAVLIPAGGAFAQGTGRSLDIQPGARQNGMGAAGVALAEDATGVTWWNPAALGFVNRSAVEITYAQLVPGLANDVSYNYATYVRPLEGWGAFGIGLVFLTYGTSDETDASGNVIGQFTSNEVSPAVYYGTKLLPDFSVGASLKFIRIQLAPEKNNGVGQTFGLDVAGLYRIPAAKLNLGVNVQNIGPSVTFLNEDEKSPLSRNVRVGTAWEATSTKEFSFLVVADFNQSLVTNKFRTYNGGVELKYTDKIAGRLGYYDDPLGEIQDLTYGLGLEWKGLSLDYASIPQAKDSGLPNVNKITLGYRF
jgi:long-subunit fatty acid transport protein